LRKASTFVITPEIMNFARILAPILGITFIFAVTQLVAYRKGDKTDRDKIRQQKINEKEIKKKEEREIRLIRSAFEMAEAGKSVAQIEELLGRYNVKITREEIASIVIGREQRQRKTKSSSQRSHKSSDISKEDKDRKIKKSDPNYKHNLVADLQEIFKVADSKYKDTILQNLKLLRKLNV
jgi:hypothetical protein